MITHLIAAAIPRMSRGLPERLSLMVHITAGSVAIIVGYIALYSAKGGTMHRHAGLVFVYAMIVMGVLGAAVATIFGRSAFINVPAGLMSAYFVITALLTVRPPATASRTIDFALLLVPLGMGLTFLTFGIAAVAAPTHMFRGIPAPPFFIFPTFAAFAVVGDVRMIRAGGVRALRGAPRVTRHLWRMCLGLFIASASFFLGQAKVIPAPIRIFPLLAIPPLLAIVALFYWLWRVRRRRSLRGFVVTRP